MNEEVKEQPTEISNYIEKGEKFVEEEKACVGILLNLFFSVNEKNYTVTLFNFNFRDEHKSAFYGLAEV